MDDLFSRLKTKLAILNERVWDYRALWPQIEEWLGNFTGEVLSKEEEHLYCLFILSQFMYFGQREMRELLRALYRDSFLYPTIALIRRRGGNTTDLKFIESELRKELLATRFLGVGNPSESGVHLLYYFRQENNLSKDLFLETHKIFVHLQDENSRKVELRIRDKSVRRYVFIDDICATGTQAIEYSNDLVTECVNDFETPCCGN